MIPRFGSAHRLRLYCHVNRLSLPSPADLHRLDRASGQGLLYRPYHLIRQSFSAIQFARRSSGSHHLLRIDLGLVQRQAADLYRAGRSVCQSQCRFNSAARSEETPASTLGRTPQSSLALLSEKAVQFFATTGTVEGAGRQLDADARDVEVQRRLRAALARGPHDRRRPPGDGPAARGHQFRSAQGAAIDPRTTRGMRTKASCPSWAKACSPGARYSCGAP